MTTTSLNIATEMHPLDIAGIGIGPFNLSVAALLDDLPEVRARFFDQRECFNWHPGLMLPDVELQSSFLKDLVTPINPTNRWSILSYFVEHKRLYAYLNAQYFAIPRQEMANYFAWAAEGLPNLQFSSKVNEVDFDGKLFQLRFDGQTVAAKNISVATGVRPFRPEWAEGLPQDRCFHCADSKWFLDSIKPTDRVIVVGGGQSGGETVDYLLSSGKAPRDLKWLSRRVNFEPMNETQFSNQVFSPEYVKAHRTLNAQQREKAVLDSLMTSDGLSLSTIDSIYRDLYRMRFIDKAESQIRMMPNRNVFAVADDGDEFKVEVENTFDGGSETFYADVIILGTGFRFRMPEAMAPLQARLSYDAQGRAIPGDDYALQWDGPSENRIFAQNAGRYTHGIADSQLSLMAWRSGIIVNELLGRDVFDVGAPDPIVDWATTQPQAQRMGVAAE